MAAAAWWLDDEMTTLLIFEACAAMLWTLEVLAKYGLEVGCPPMGSLAGAVAVALMQAAILEGCWLHRCCCCRRW